MSGDETATFGVYEPTEFDALGRYPASHVWPDGFTRFLTDAGLVIFGFGLLRIVRKRRIGRARI